ncbi:MAG: hypothetical protein E7511_05780 [Ruminococcus sp.]|nr:hypothetical protein [Ruminococcus sp.]
MSDEQIRKKEWLNRGYPLRMKLLGKYAVRRERVARAEYSGIQYDKTGSGGHSGNAMQAKLDSIADVEAEIAQLEQELDAVEAEVEQAIRSVGDDTLRSILEQHYLGYLSFARIGREIGYGKENMIKLHKKALDAVKSTPEYT